MVESRQHNGRWQWWWHNRDGQRWQWRNGWRDGGAIAECSAAIFMNGGDGQRRPDVDAKGVNDGREIAMGNSSNSAMDGRMAAMGDCRGLEG